MDGASGFSASMTEPLRTRLAPRHYAAPPTSTSLSEHAPPNLRGPGPTRRLTQDADADDCGRQGRPRVGCHLLRPPLQLCAGAVASPELRTPPLGDGKPEQSDRWGRRQGPGSWLYSRAPEVSSGSLWGTHRTGVSLNGQAH